MPVATVQDGEAYTVHDIELGRVSCGKQTFRCGI